MRRFAYTNFQISTTTDSKLSYTPCYMNVKLTDMVDKLKKHLDFCKKYPETIVGYEQGINVSYYLMKGENTPQVNHFKVGDLVKMYNENPNVFSEYKNLKEDWNNLITTKGS